MQNTQFIYNISQESENKISILITHKEKHPDNGSIEFIWIKSKITFRWCLADFSQTGQDIHVLALKTEMKKGNITWRSKIHEVIEFLHENKIERGERLSLKGNTIFDGYLTLSEILEGKCKSRSTQQEFTIPPKKQEALIENIEKQQKLIEKITEQEKQTTQTTAYTTI